MKDDKDKVLTGMLIDNYIIDKLSAEKDEWKIISTVEVVDFVKEKGYVTHISRVFNRLQALQKEDLIEKKKERLSRVPFYRLTEKFFKLHEKGDC